MKNDSGGTIPLNPGTYSTKTVSLVDSRMIFSIVAFSLRVFVIVSGYSNTLRSSGRIPILK